MISIKGFFQCFSLSLLMAGAAHAQKAPFDIMSLKPGDNRAQFEKIAAEQKCRIVPSSFFSSTLEDGTEWHYYYGTECAPVNPDGNVMSRDISVMLSSPKSKETIYMIGSSVTYKKEAGPNSEDYLDEVFALYGDPDGQFQDARNKDEGYFWIRNQAEGNEVPYLECMLQPNNVLDLDYLFKEECGTILTLRIHKEDENDSILKWSSLQLVDHRLASKVRLMDD